MRKFGAIAAVAMTLVLAAGCTTSTVPSTTTTTAPVSKTVSRADLARFVALAHEGLREPFEAAFRHLPPEDRPDFSLWYEPTGADSENSSFVYEAAFGHGTFRFIKNRSGDFECLRASLGSAWRCVGPFGPQSIGQFQQVDGYRLPIFAVENLTTNVSGPLTLFHKTVLGRRLWCLAIQSGSYLCLTRTGQLALATDMFVSGQLEAVSLALNPSPSAFVPPAKPTPWNKGGLPNLCGKVQCPSNGLL